MRRLKIVPLPFFIATPFDSNTCHSDRTKENEPFLIEPRLYDRIKLASKIGIHVLELLFVGSSYL